MRSSIILSLVALAASSPVSQQLEERNHDGPFPMPLCQGVDINRLSVSQAQDYFKSGKLSIAELTKCYEQRIEQVNGKLNAVSEVNPDALAIAKELDEELAAGKSRGPLHGIPFLAKDNLYSDDKHNTSEGGLVLLGGRYSVEAPVITKAREAGMVHLGHAAMSEAADHRALSNFSDGYSARVGQTRNPFNLTQGTSGSSGGSAVSIQANLALLTIGTETHGSILTPACQLGIVGIKPTPGLVSRTGVVAGSFLHDTVGPFAHKVKDAAMLLDAIHGVDRYDNLTFSQIGHAQDSYAKCAKGKDGIKGLKLGVPWNPYWNTSGVINSPGSRELYEGRLQELKDAGVTIYNVTLPNIDEIQSAYGFGQNPALYGTPHDGLIAFNTLLDAGLAEWLTNWTYPEGDERNSFTTLSDMAEWNDAHNETTGALGSGYWWYNTISGQDFYDNAIATGGRLDDTFWTAMDFTRRMARNAIDQGHIIIQEDGSIVELDGLLIPSQNAGGYDNPVSSQPAYAGYPAISVPMGLNGFNVPAAMGIWGKAFSEGKLIQAASALEAIWGWKEEPQYYNVDTPEARWETPYPGYACTAESLDRMACDRPE